MQKHDQPVIYCLDLEGVLVPEIWIEVAKRFKIDALKLTTRDISDYDKLMKYRLDILRKENIRLRDIQKVINAINPLPGAVSFLRKLQSYGPVIILSDTYYEFARPLMKKLGNPVLFCNSLEQDKQGFISDYKIRIRDGKKKAVLEFKKLCFSVKASGDSYNDLTMINTADGGVLFNPPEKILKSHPHVPVAKSYQQLLDKLLS